MMTRYPALFLLLVALAVPVVQADEAHRINTVLDGFHAAAADADYDRYTELMAQDIVFLGTDAGERWQGRAFTDFAQPHFENGKGWTYLPRDRSISLSADGSVAWFDELLSHEKLGTCRGSGVLVREAGEWKIAQYNLSVPIPNDLVYGVAEQVRVYESGDDSVTVGTATATATAPATVAEDVDTEADEPAKQCRERRHKTNRKASC